MFAATFAAVACRLFARMPALETCWPAADACDLLDLQVVVVGVDRVMVPGVGNLGFDYVFRFLLIVRGDESLADDGIDVGHAVESFRGNGGVLTGGRSLHGCHREVE